MIRQCAGKAIRQQPIVVLLQAIGRIILRMGGVRPVGVLQGVETVAGGWQGGAGPLQRFELQQRARSGGGGGPGGPRRRRVLVVGRYLLMMVVVVMMIGAMVAPASLLRHHWVAFAATAIQPFVFREQDDADEDDDADENDGADGNGRHARTRESKSATSERTRPTLLGILRSRMLLFNSASLIRWNPTYFVKSSRGNDPIERSSLSPYILARTHTHARNVRKSRFIQPEALLTRWSPSIVKQVVVACDV